MQHSRLLSILLRLQAEGRVSARSLARAFEVSVRTIYRDVDSLSAAGVPVYSERGRNGGFRLHGGYRTQLTGLDRPEAQTLLLAGAPFAATQLGLGPAVETVRLKLLAALPDAASRDAERVASRFHLDPTAWFQGPDEHAILPRLALAVWAGRTLALRYESWKGIVDRRVTPLGLVQKAGLWYLVAAVGRQARTYRVASIVDLVVEDHVAPRPARFDLQRYWREFARDYEARMQSERAHVRARPSALRELARISDATSRAVAAATACDDEGWHALTIPIESIDAAVRELSRFGAQVEVLGTPRLRAAMRDAASALHALYAPKTPRVRKR